MGGIAVDLSGRTTLPGLWACGEVASTGVHGANRLASNSLLEALVYARRVAADIAANTARAANNLPHDILHIDSHRAPAPANAAAEPISESALRTLMFENAGVVRDRRGLTNALAKLDTAALNPGALRNMITVARLIVNAALQRDESRGSHFRSDAPNADIRYAQRRAISL
jgi:L-aspartate oxidase